ncbi:gustatory receptor for bitter taste 93a [Zeugodacus cucurbitae]|uniref:gustatory receptor for bitter taste 93a n=1 Tax=Zeugodacus cucurbitae TaxID=28588 RepID=UPI0023D92695|nr:gustatory receptor for bitter taste 93a [Zeugodacus cucurbitae]
MPKYNRAERFAYRTLIVFYNYGRLLSVFSWKLQKHTRKMELQQAKCTNRLLRIIWRTLLTLIFLTLMPKMMAPFLRLSAKGFLLFFANIQVVTVTLFSVISFVIHERSDRKIFHIINQLVTMYERISAKSGVQQLLGRTFVVSVIAKFLLSILGLVYEIPLLLGDKEIVKSLSGIYLWLGTIYTLDCCFLGFLVIRQMYVAMATHLEYMLEEMSAIESEEPRKRLSKYQRIKLLCMYSESIDDSNNIYSILYELTKQFQHIFRWQVLYYIYYNFVIILMLMHRFIWRYFESNFVDIMSFFSSVFKFCNLAFLILSTNGVVEKSQLPDLLNLDLVCSDIDARWDESVETFICQRKVENLEIKVMGFFHLNNEFILVIISAIMSYLFILIQFGLTKQQ